jgi:hypothetical protein
LNKVFKIAVLLAMTIIFQACTWVKATPSGQKVVVAQAGTVDSCENKGEVESALKSRVGGFERNATKVKDEIETLARNEAAKMGGDTIVALSNVRDGKQNYGVYRCRSSS